MTPEGSGGGSGKLPSVTELVTQRQQSDDPSLHRQSSVASSIGQATNNTDQPTQLHQVWPLTQLFFFSKMIETQKHQQSFEALGLFQIDFGLMTLISEIFLSTLFNSSLNILHNFL